MADQHETGEAGDVVVEVSGLVVRRGKKNILDGVDWEIRRGEHWVIMGANGCGKTSLLSTLTGYLTPTAGEIRVFGRKFGTTDWRELRKAIGIVSSAIRQLVEDGETAIEVVASGKDALINLWETPSDKMLMRAEGILKEVECEDLAGRPWLYLSQGERQRVLIGRALMANPPLLILDEPCAGLDPVAREHFLAFVERLASRPSAPTLVLVTHHVEEVMPVFTHTLLMREGTVSASGRKSDVLTDDLLGQTFATLLHIRQGAEGRFEMRLGGENQNSPGWEIGP